ncbi:MAG: carboxymuconolactone decarboxylase family protein [Actinomycetota bacterium]|jgi:AhpD family alkylhydroperoxidase|nr:carboxymuconolactone decarboxylase family protein [Actinomycetota bacterium]
MGHYHEESQRYNATAAELRKLIPGTYDGYREMHKQAMTEGELTVGVKELIALSYGIAERCDSCIASHARGAARAGVTTQQVAEAISVAVMMQGGPGTVYGAKAFEAFKEFQEKYA